jgi:hypothetical protein
MLLQLIIDFLPWPGGKTQPIEELLENSDSNTITVEWQVPERSGGV